MPKMSLNQAYGNYQRMGCDMGEGEMGRELVRIREEMKSGVGDGRYVW